MDKRAILAIILTFLVVVVWEAIQSRYFRKETPQVDRAPLAKGKRIDNSVYQRELAGATVYPPADVARQKMRYEEKEVIVETEKYRAVFTTEGARLKQLQLKGFYDRVEEAAMTVKISSFFRKLFGLGETTREKPKLLDLVNTREVEGLPLGLELNSSAILNTAVWEVDREGIKLNRKGEKGVLSFWKDFEGGLRIQKRFIFVSDQHEIEAVVALENRGKYDLPAEVGLEWAGRVELEKLAENDIRDYGLGYSFLKNGKVEGKELGGRGGQGCTPGCGSPKKNIEPFELVERGIEWFAFGGQYFTALIIPAATKDPAVLTIRGVSENNVVRAVVKAPGFVLKPGELVELGYRMYVGPKEEAHLKKLGVGAERLIDFGFFSVIAKPLLWFLNLTHRATKNYGLDIIILSILIKIVFLPLTQISYRSMKEMQKVQPEMARIRQMYKNDKARLQQEIMLLYKRRKINPMSGCLPMAIQIPVFIALYNVLQGTFEMRHAPFVLWIRDLSAKDPIYFTPLVMGASMVIQQKMTPSTADPAQTKMFMLMPIIFTFLFLNFPSGLVLYWLVNNVLSIAHQYYLNKIS